MPSIQTRYRTATAIAVIFYIVMLTGILFFDKASFISITPYGLLMMFALLLFTQQKINISFVLFFVICSAAGFGAAAVGINSGLLFGEFTYGTVPGPRYQQVPLLIGLNWFLIIFCSGTAVSMVLEKLSVKLSQMTGAPSPAIKLFSVVSDGAILAVFFDWVMEPAAVKLGYWHWLGDGSVPAYNYLCRFIISAVLMATFAALRFNKQNIFALNLLMILMMFYMLIRTFI